MTDENNSLSLKDFILQNKIGFGAFGKVYKAKNRKTKEIYAAKISNSELDDDSDKIIRDISREVNIISKLNHPSVLKFIFFSPINFKNKLKPVIITEFASNGTLKDFLEPNNESALNIYWNDTRKLIIIYGIASAMSYLHSHNIIHRDLKPDNILIDEYFFPKVADFGLSKSVNSEIAGLNSTLGSIKGTPIYISPEIWFKNDYSPACDVYAFGMIVYQIYMKKKIFENCHFFDIPIMLRRGYRPEIDSHSLPSSYINLIIQCWQEDPKERPTFDQIVSQLKNDRGFITEKIDKEEFMKYVNYIDTYNTTFDSSKNAFYLKRPALQNKIQETKYDMKILESLKIFPYKDFIQIKRGYLKKLIMAAETDTEKQFEIAQYLIEGQFELKHNVQLGLKYLKHAIINKNIKAIVYYCKMLIKGSYIPQNFEKAKKLINKYLSDEESISSLLYGKIYRKENQIQKAKECFERSIKFANSEAMYEYGKMLFKDNKDEAINYFKMAAQNNFGPAMVRYGLILIKQQNKKEKNKGYYMIEDAAEKLNLKALYYHGSFFEKKEPKTSIKFLEISANRGHILSMIKYATLLAEQKIPTFKEISPLFLKKAADKGSIEAMFLYQNYLKDDKERIKFIRIAAYNDYAEAMNLYAFFITEDRIANESKLEAEEFYKKAIAKGNIKAMNNYARMLEFGNGVPVNIKEAAKYFKMGIQKDDPFAMNNYAYMIQKAYQEGADVDIKEAVKYYKRSIVFRHTSAMINYGDMLENGYGVEVNIEEAKKYYQMASDYGNPGGLYCLALLLMKTETNNNNAIKYLQKAIEKGDAHSMTEYANILRSGEKNQNNINQAVSLYKKAINLGDTNAMNHYEIMLLFGDEIPANKKEAEKYCKMAVDRGNESAMLTYAHMLLHGEGVTVNIEEAIKYYKMLISKGNAIAMHNYAFMLFYGDDGVTINKEEGIKYFKMAIEHGYTKSMKNYAEIVEEGDGVPANKAEAIKYYKMAADGGLDTAMNYYAYILIKGDGIEKNTEEGVKYLKMAIDKGNTNAMTNLGIILVKGEDVEMNQNEGMKYLRMAADLGNSIAMHSLGNIYKLGLLGEVDVERAIKYYKLAIEHGDKDAEKELNSLINQKENIDT